MEMEMIQQGLVPGMEQCDETDVSAKVRVADSTSVSPTVLKR
jgi:hypothetical protein